MSHLLPLNASPMGSFYNSRLSYKFIESGYLLCRFILFDELFVLSFFNLNEVEASGNLWMAWLIFQMGSHKGCAVINYQRCGFHCNPV